MKKHKEVVPSMPRDNKIGSYFFDLLDRKDFQIKIKELKKINLAQNKQDLFIKLSEFKENKSNNINLHQKINELCREFALNEIIWNKIITNYIKNGKLPKENLDNFCVVSEKNDFDEYYNEDYEISNEQLKDIEKEKAWSYNYPIVIHISPYASQRDITDYIRKTYTKEIKPIQEKYKNKNIRLGKIKIKDIKIQERNEYIYKNKHLPRKEISSLVVKKFGEYIDYGHIGKIISNINKKRK